MIKLKTVGAVRQRERELLFNKINKGGNTFICNILERRTIIYKL